MIQRDIIYEILEKHAGNYITDRIIMEECHKSGNPKVIHITMPPIRRCLQELRDRGKADWIPGEFDKMSLTVVSEALWRYRA